jgi:hypothetical protein
MALFSKEAVTDPQIVDQAKRTYYQLHGKEIVAIRPRGRPKTFSNPEFQTMEVKTDAAALYCVYGSTKEVAKILHLEESLIKQWKTEPWWFEIQKQVFVEQNEKLASQLSQTLDKTMTELSDRLENGDYTYNPKTGDVTRKPIEAKVIISIFDSLAHQRRVTRGEPTSISAKIGVDDRLRLLQDAFIKFSQSKDITADAVVVEG